MKKYGLYIVLMVIFLGGIIVSQMSENKPVDWRPTFSKKDKIPYGLKIFYDLLTEKYKNSDFENYNYPFYTFSQENEDDSAVCLYIVRNGFNPGASDIRNLLDYAAQGNTIFIVANEMGDAFLDSIKVRLANNFYVGNDSARESFNFVNPRLRADSDYYFKKSLVVSRFSSLDSENITILGETGDKHPDFIKVHWGNGNIILSCNAYTFTNAGILAGRNEEYVEKCLSYMPVTQKVYWFEYIEDNRSASLLSYIFSQPPLKYAYLLLLIGLLIYVLFEGKRRQKIIPVIPPLKNSSVEFAETIGRLYYQEATHKNIAEKKISYFYEFLRNRLMIKKIEPGDNLYFRLSTKTGMDRDDIKKIFTLIGDIKVQHDIDNAQLLEINRLIDDFYKHF